MTDDALYEVLWKLGPQARAALPRLVEFLSDKQSVFVARMTIDRMIPGYYEQLPDKTKQAADRALYEALLDPQLRRSAAYFAHYLSNELAMKLLQSEDHGLHELAFSIATSRPKSELHKQAQARQLERLADQGLAWDL